MDSKSVQGLEKLLPANQRLFKQFYKRYLKQWDDPAGHEPVKVSFKRDKANGAYLMVELADGSWLHVKGATCWY